MSFLKHLRPQWDRLNLRNMKRQVTLLLIFSLFSLLFFLFNTIRIHYDKDRRMILPARENHSDFSKPTLKAYKHFRYDHYTYITGTNGDLYYKPVSLGEAFLLNRIGGKNLIDYLFFTAAGFMIFFTVLKASDQKSFSRRLIHVFYAIAMLFFLVPMIKFFFQEFVTSPLLVKRTNGLFELSDDGMDMTGSLVPFLIILITLYFLKRGMDLEEEQELTV